MSNPHTLSRLAEAMDMDPDDIRHLMSVYRPELQKDLSAASELMENQDWAAFRLKLHKLKGDAADLCFQRFSKLAAEMESLVPPLHPSAIESTWSRLTDEAASIIQFIDSMSDA